MADMLTEPFTVQHRPLPSGQIAAMLEAEGLVRTWTTAIRTSHPRQLSGG